MRSIRKFVGGGAAALALGGFLAFIVAPQLAAEQARNVTPQIRTANRSKQVLH